MEGETIPNEVFEQSLVNKSTQESSLLANQNRALNYQMEEAEQTLAEAQLDCEETLTNINHLLKQDIYKFDEKKQQMDWFPIEDSKKRVLTEEGVDKIMQIMRSYINKETLLSNFSEEQIDRRMLEFSLGLSALFFMKYEIYFRYPTLKECYEILKKRIEDKLEKKEKSCELIGIKFDEKKEKEKLLEELKGREEYEITKIKSETRKLNLREFEMMFIQLKSLVEATHNRAWKGEERGSLRRHMNINEIIGGKPQGRKEKRRWGIF